MRVLAVDPGPEKSGFVLWDGARVWESESEVPNEKLLLLLSDGAGFPFDPIGTETVVFEKVESFGMSVGASVFETVFWTGRFFEEAVQWAGCHRLGRRDVKLHLCGSAKAKDANIRQSLIDRFGEPGTKKNPGALHGVKSHAWAALALAVTFYDKEAIANVCPHHGLDVCVVCLENGEEPVTKAEYLRRKGR